MFWSSLFDAEAGADQIVANLYICLAKASKCIQPYRRSINETAMNFVIIAVGFSQRIKELSVMRL